MALRKSPRSYGHFLVDRPTQLICIWIFVCWVVGGDPYGVADFCISAPWKGTRKAGSDRFLFKITVFITLGHLAQNSWNKGSLKSRIPKIRDPSFQEFPKWGIPQIMNSWNEGSILFQFFARNIKLLSIFWYSWDSLILNCIKEFLMLAVYVKYWSINHFLHSYKRRYQLAIFSSNTSFQEFLIWGIPHFGNSWNEGSLILGIPKTRDPWFH